MTHLATVLPGPGAVHAPVVRVPQKKPRKKAPRRDQRGRFASLPQQVKSRLCAAQVVLAVAGIALSGVGIAINGWYARSLGATDTAGWLFLAVGVASDLAALALPTCATLLWERRARGSAAVAWGTWSVTLVFAVVAAIGFASQNLADVTKARAERVSPIVELAKDALRDAKAARDRECVKVGPVCRTREETVVARQRALDEALAAARREADPQARAAATLATWVTGGFLKPTPEDVEGLRLLLLALLPQLGGLVLAGARRAAPTPTQLKKKGR